MELHELQENWDAFGKSDPLWAILADPTKMHGKWTRDEFFKTGEDEISVVMRHIGSLNIDIPRRRALDFGCGIGRLTQALCRHFEECCGVDIAPSMIMLANRHNRHGNKCRYYINESSDLRLFGDNSFDFVYSNITLQHMRPEYSKSYIREFLRILSPGGLIVFQIPDKEIAFQYESTSPGSLHVAQITLLSSFVSARPGTHNFLAVRVKNVSDSTWPASLPTNGSFQVRLGNHWLDKNRNVLVNDDGRAALPSDLAPGSEVELNLCVTTPKKPGSYILELDMVQEGVAWFKDNGSATVRINVEIRRPALLDACCKISHAWGALLHMFGGALSRCKLRKFNPIMEMYSIPRDEVIELINRNGGTVVSTQKDKSAGERWISYRYYATK